MVQIIKHGAMGHKYIAQCLGCGCEFVFDDNDTFVCLYQDKNSLYIDCPECRNKMFVGSCHERKRS